MFRRTLWLALDTALYIHTVDTFTFRTYLHWKSERIKKYEQKQNESQSRGNNVKRSVRILLYLAYVIPWDIFNFRYVPIEDTLRFPRVRNENL